MKIAIDIRNIGKQRTGSEVVVLELTKNILRLDEENEYLLLTDTDDEVVLENIKKSLELSDKGKAQIISLKAKNKFIWAAWTLPRYMHKNKLDVFHTEYILPFFIPKNIKVVTHIHDVSFKVYREFILKRDLFFLDLLIPRSIKRSDKIIAVSQFTKDEIIKYYKINPHKIAVVFNSINIIEGVATEEKKKYVREKYNLPEKFILYIGTLQPRKNVSTLIEAYTKIKKQIPDIKLVLAGDRGAHNFDKKIDEVISKNNLTNEEVLFTGFIGTLDKSLVYQMAEVFVYPSFYEGFGIPILEAMSQGVAVVVSDIAPHREVAQEAGTYFPPASLDILADKLYNICINQQEKNRLIQLGLDRVTFFSWQKSAREMLEIFNSFK